MLLEPLCLLHEHRLTVLMPRHNLYGPNLYNKLTAYVFVASAGVGGPASARENIPYPTTRHYAHAHRIMNVLNWLTAKEVTFGSELRTES